MLLGGPFCDDEPFGNALVGPSLGDQLEDFAFAGSELRDRVVPAAADDLGDDRRVSFSMARAAAAEAASASE